MDSIYKEVHFNSLKRRSSKTGFLKLELVFLELVSLDNKEK